MNSRNKKRSNGLVGEIQSNDIDVVIDDLELMESGCVINYVIDPFDIFRFCFPYGIKHDTEREIYDIGEEMIGYTYFFKHNKPIIVDEYKLELFVNRNNVNSSFRENVNKNLYDELEKRLGDAKSKREKEVIYSELANSATFLLASAHLTKTFIERFDFIYRVLQIDNFMLENRKDEQIILQTFRENRRSLWSSEAFKDWVHEKDSDNHFRELDEKGNFISKPAHKITNELKTTFTDYVVIDRICNINNELQNNRDLDGKYLFLYFSSAKKSTEIFSKKETRDHLPTIQSIDKRYDNFDILRSIRHFYLRFLYSDEDPQSEIENLKELREIVKKSENVEVSLDLTKIKERSRVRLRREFETFNIKNQIKKLEKFQESLADIIHKIDQAKQDWSELRKIYDDLLSQAKLVDYDINPLTNMNVEYSVQSSFSSLVGLLSDEKELTVHKGLDLIEGTYQHLPVLLFFDEENQIPYKLRKLLLEVIGFVVNSPKIRRQEMAKFSEKIKGLYTESEKLYLEADKSESQNYYYPGILIKSLIYLILPYRSYDETNDSKKNDEIQESDALIFAIDGFEPLDTAKKFRDDKLTDLYYLMKKRELSYDKWHLEYRYFLIWAYRRNKKFDKSLELAEEAIKIKKDDPRFHHGKCLALHNKYADDDNLNIVELACLEPLIESAEEAIRLYEGKKNTNQHYDKLIDGSILALNNTLLYAVSLSHLHSLENSIPHPFENKPELSKKYSLQKLRDDLLKKIKEHYASNKQNYKDYPELLHSKSVFELCEAISYFYSNSKKAVDTIRDARDSINMAINNAPIPISYYEPTKGKIEDWEIRISESQ